MKFWELMHPSSRTALVDEETGQMWSYGDLKLAAEQFHERVGSGKQLGFILCSNTAECIAAYVGGLQAGSAVALFSGDVQPDFLSRFVSLYRPSWIFSAGPREIPPGFHALELSGREFLWLADNPRESDIALELAVLLPTSGTTGAPKLVRLSYSNIQSNAKSIAEYLRLDAGERPITSLPMPYSYGLSVINSHLLVGAGILLTNRSVLQREFWEFVEAAGATSLAGVPYTYQMLVRASLLDRDLPITTFTQAGGRLDPKILEQILSINSDRGRRLFVMYGQTEATARISYVPWEYLAENLGSIGIPIPGGSMRIDAGSGELVYCGPNVMLGYAHSSDDLSRGDELHGELYTGDVGHVDKNGMFYITGRMKRFVKICGMRLSLDEIERALNRQFSSSIICLGSDDQLQIAMEDDQDVYAVVRFCCRQFKLHHSVVRVIAVPQIPLNVNGKPDYSKLAALKSEAVVPGA